MKYILIFFYFIFLGCSQSIYLTGTDPLKDAVKNELLEERVKIKLKDSTQKEVFIHHIQKDTLTVVGFDVKDENTIIYKIALSDIKNISHQVEGAGLAGFIIGLSQGVTSSDHNDAFYAPVAYFLYNGLIAGPPAIGWIVGSTTDVNKIYSMEVQSFPQFYIGTRFGTTFSFINQSDLLHTRSNISRDFGLFYDYNFNRYHALQFDLNYLNSGARWENNHDYISYDLSSILTSLMFKTNYFFKSYSRKNMVCAGFYYEYNIQAKQKWSIEEHYYTSDTNKDSPDIHTNFSDEINKNMFGSILGVQLPFFFDEWRCQFLWYYSITELYKKNYPKYRGDFASKRNFHRNMFIFSMDYLF